MEKNCLTCKNLMSCSEPRKGPNKLCGNFAPALQIKLDDLWNPEQPQIERSGRRDAVILPTATAELDLVDLMDNLFDVNNQVMYDLKVDDRDFPEFPNFYEFCMSPDGLNSPLWARQFWLCMTLLNEICPVCTTRFRTVDDVPKKMAPEDFAKRVTFMHYGRCKTCGNTRLSLFRKGLMNPYNELAGLAGQRIGKSLIVAAVMVYLTHKFLKLQDPSKIYGVLRTTFVGTMVGLTFDKAIQQLWLPYRGFIDNSDWFKGYHAMLKETGQRQGKELLKYGQVALHYLHRNLLVHPAGPNKKTLRGNTRIFAACVHADTEVMTNFGRTCIKHIKTDLHKAIIDGKEYTISRLLYQSYKPIFRLTTVNGLFAVVTADHKFRCNDAWTRLDELKVGDVIAVEDYNRREDSVLSIEACGMGPVYDITVPDLGFFVGNGIILKNCDELDFFLSDDAGEDNVKMNGVEVTKSLTNSLFTVRIGWKDAIKRGVVNVQNAYQLNISSPQSARGVLTEKVKRSTFSKKIFTFHLATWDVHPNVTEKDIRTEFADEPEKADRDFGAIPPMADRPFLTVDTAMTLFGTQPNLVRLQYIHSKSPTGAIRRAAKIVHAAKPSSLPAAVLAIDAGYSNNSFGIAVGFPEKIGKDARRLRFPIVQEIIPEKGRVTLDYTKIFSEVVFPIIREYNVQAVLADRWNSIKLLHDIEHEFGIPAEMYSIKYRDFHLLKSYIEAGLLVLPKRETDDVQKVLALDLQVYPKCFDGRPADHLFLQTCTVSDNDKDVVKGTKLTDDIWRAMALGAVKLLDEAWCLEHLKESKRGGSRGILAVAGSIGVYGVDGNSSIITGKADVSHLASIGSPHVSMSAAYRALTRR